MISNDSAIDTIFGAIILILGCFACSSIVLALDNSWTDDSAVSISEIEERFDICLLSTITIDRKVLNVTVWENVQLVDYLMLQYQMFDDDSNLFINAEEKDRIKELLEFYFNWSEYWRLDFVINTHLSLAIAEKGFESAKSDLVVLERAIQGINGQSCIISFTIEL